VLADLRDISIILLAIESIVIGVILLLLLWQVRLLVLLLRDEVQPILKDTQETTRTLQSTTRFLGKRAAKPVVATASFFAGVRRAVKAMTDPLFPEQPGGGAMPGPSEPPPTLPPSSPPGSGLDS
jgi:hypothetical protein